MTGEKCTMSGIKQLVPNSIITIILSLHKQFCVLIIVKLPEILQYSNQRIDAMETTVEYSEAILR